MEFDSEQCFSNTTRRQFFGQSGLSLGTAALAMLMGRSGASVPGPQFIPRAKRVIFLFQSGGPSQLDLFDYKSKLKDLHGTELPDSVRRGQRLTGFTAGQKSKPLASSKYQFRQHGTGGTWVSELLPHTSKVVDDLCVIRSVHTEAINHDPAITLIQSGNQLAGHPSLGAWLSYGLGSANADLPTFVTMISLGTGRPDAEPLYARLWGSGYLPSLHQGVKFRASGDPVLYLSNPPGIAPSTRRQLIDDVNQLNRRQLEDLGDPEIATRIAQYELAYRMQASVPQLVDVSGEPDEVFNLYGPDSRKPGSFAANCIQARRLAERGVRCIQLFHRGWDQHNDLPRQISRQCRDVDQPSAALIRDLKRRGLLDDTLVIWGGEFGRTAYCQGKLSASNYGRDHHPRCFSMWMAGGPVKGGVTYGETDDFGYNVASDPVHIHDLNATILHCLGIDHRELTFRFQGLNQRLTGVTSNPRVLRRILA